MAKKYYEELNDAARERVMQRQTQTPAVYDMSMNGATTFNEPYNAALAAAANEKIQQNTGVSESNAALANSTPTANALPDVTAATPQEQNNYGSRIDALYDAIINREPFSYDYNNDPVYQQMRMAAISNGQAAMEDTLGKLAARTGGLASSYATSTAQQAYNNYLTQLNSSIPSLRDAAYQMYNAQNSGTSSSANTTKSSTKLSQFYNDTAAYIKELAVTDKQKAANELYAAIENGEITEQEGTRIARMNGLMDEDAAETQPEGKNMSDEEIYEHVQSILRNSGINAFVIASPTAYAKTTGASSTGYAKYARGVLKRKNLTEYIDF